MKIKSCIKSFIEAIAALASFATIVTICFCIKTENLSLIQSWYLIFLLFVIAIIYSIAMNKKRKRIKLKINEKLFITIEEGNLFEKCGIIVIPVNEYFDTHVGDGVISPNSIHGQFINKYYKNKTQELDNIIDEKLKGIAYTLQQRKKIENVILKNKKYDLGTCINFDEKENTYVLFALTHFDNDNIAYIDANEYDTAFRALLNYLQRIAEDKTIYMPLLGTKFCRIIKKDSEILDFMIKQINFLYHNTAFLGGLYIEIKDLSNIDLNELKI